MWSKVSLLGINWAPLVRFLLSQATLSWLKINMSYPKDKLGTWAQFLESWKTQSILGINMNYPSEKVILWINWVPENIAICYLRV